MTFNFIINFTYFNQDTFLEYLLQFPMIKLKYQNNFKLNLSFIKKFLR